MHKFVRLFRVGAAEWARVGSSVTGQSHQSTHIHAQQFRLRYPDHGGQRAVHTHDSIGLIVHDNEIADRIKDLVGMTICLFDAREQLRTLQGHGRVSRHALQKGAIFFRSHSAGKTQNSSQVFVRPRQANDGAVGPSQSRGILRPQNLICGTSNDAFWLAACEFSKRFAEDTLEFSRK